MKKFAYLIPLLTLLLLTGSSCHFYKVNTIENNPYQLESGIYSGKVIIVHTANEVFMLRYPSLAEDKSMITGEAVNPGPYHSFYMNTRRTNANRYKLKEGNPEKEIHLYVNEYGREENNNIVYIPTESVKKIELYNIQGGLNTAATTGLVIVSFYGFLLVIALLGEFLF